MEADFDIKVDNELSAEYDHFLFTNRNDGGLVFTRNEDSDYLNVIKKVSMEIGGKLLKGNLDFGDMLLPSTLYSNFTGLEAIAFDFSMVVRYYLKAAQISDPLERMKYVVAGYIANLTQSVSTVKANPLIPVFRGETLDGEDSLGNKINIQQISYNQQNAIVNITGKDNLFSIETNWHNVIKVRGININALSGENLNPSKLTFKDGVEYEVC